MARRLSTLAIGGVVAAAVLVAGCVPDQPPTGPTNLAPVAAFVADPMTGSAPLQVTFDAGGSFDPDGTIASYAWDFGDGDSGTGINPMHTYTASGTHTAKLTVTDNGGATGTATRVITVTALNQAPTADIGATPDSGTAPLSVDFDSSGSNDVDGTIVTTSWMFGDGTTSTEATPTHVFTDAGLLVVTLTVTDDDGATGTASTVIAVSPNQPPSADFSATPAIGRAPLPVAFDASTSVDPEGGALAYEWDFGDGTIGTGVTPTHIFSDGSFIVTLVVTDPAGHMSIRQAPIFAAANVRPMAHAGCDRCFGPAPFTVQFSSDGSIDPDGPIGSYLWDFDDGTTSTEANPSHTFTTDGPRTVTLTVTDSDGASAVATVMVMVSPQPTPPIAVIQASGLTGRKLLPVFFDGSGSIDPIGPIVSYAWDFGDGASSTNVDPVHEFGPGTHVVTLTVTDVDGLTDTATVTVTVVPNHAPTAVLVPDQDPLVGSSPFHVGIHADGSTDDDGTIMSYDWDFGDGTTGTGPFLIHQFTAEGDHTVTLTVTDNDGATGTASIIVTVLPDQPPVAVINPQMTTGPRPLAVQFNGGSSVDPDGQWYTMRYDWDFGDGSTATDDFAPSHTFAAGTWTVTLTVTDVQGLSNTATTTVTAYVDDDNDGESPPTDCNDSNAAINSYADDPLDAAGLDTNCDGHDGVVADQVYVAAAFGSDTATCGTPTAACATIAKGLARATELGRDDVSVAGGSYSSFTAGPGPLFRVRGGFGQNLQHGTAATGSTTVTIGAAYQSSVNGQVGVLVSQPTGGSTLADLTVNGGDAGPGMASYGIVVRNNFTLSPIVLENVIVNAGKGGVGSNGTNGTSATQTAAAGGGGGEAAEQALGCSSSRKSGGGGGTTSVAGANGGNGGQGGARDSSCPFSLSATSGIGGANAATVVGSNGMAGGGGSSCDCSLAGAGGNGQPGRVSNGSGGAAGSGGTAGTIDSLGRWSASGGTGGSGSLGLDGTGGGGGGGGGGNDNGTDSMGGGGGGGGAGGAKASAVGTGGTAGSASIGIAIYLSNVRLTNVTVNLGTGGTGGVGGAGGIGQPGGAAGPGGPTNNPGGRGGDGGAGGAGGASGAGGGGQGGPSIGIIGAGSGNVITESSVTLTGGSGGAGGAGGTAGVGGSAGTAGSRTLRVGY